MTERLKYVSELVLADLIDHLPERIDRYVNGDFLDLASEFGWAVETTGVTFDRERLTELQLGATTPESEVHNSLVVHDALKGISRSVAREERIWVRLCHIECLDYARSRWLTDLKQEELEAQIKKHFFAHTLPQVRDDNAVGRLWWNAEIASIASPGDVGHGLKLMLQTADIRLNLVQRTRLVSRPVLARGIVRALSDHAWLAAQERNFRRFMRILNRDGGGVLYEALPEKAVDDLILTAIKKAQATLAVTA